VNVSMRLYEYTSKDLLSKFGIPTPKGILTSSSSTSFEHLQFPVVIKAQVLVGGRGKAGGIKVAASPSDATVIINKMIGSEIEGIKVQKVLVEEKAEVVQELYLSSYMDRARSTTVLMASEYGGVEIEKTPYRRIFNVEVNPLIGTQDYMIHRLLSGINVNQGIRTSIAMVAQNLYRVFNDCDAELVEINPLAVTSQGQIMALDAKILIDDNAIFRHPDFQNLDRGMTEFEKKTRELGVNGVEINGEIGIVTSGAGCLMATMDNIRSFGGDLGPTIDLGGSVFNTDTIDNVILGCVSELKKLQAKVILFNAYFQLARSDFVARAIASSFKGTDDIPIVVRLKGRADHEVRRILSGCSNVFLAGSFDEACEKAVELVKGSD